jgi:hypothetical protein
MNTRLDSCLAAIGGMAFVELHLANKGDQSWNRKARDRTPANLRGRLASWVGPIPIHPQRQRQPLPPAARKPRVH